MTLSGWTSALEKQFDTCTGHPSISEQHVGTLPLMLRTAAVLWYLA